jgi:chromosome segregation ATPase
MSSVAAEQFAETISRSAREVTRARLQNHALSSLVATEEQEVAALQEELQRVQTMTLKHATEAHAASQAEHERLSLRLRHIEEVMTAMRGDHRKLSRFVELQTTQLYSGESILAKFTENLNALRQESQSTDKRISETQREVDDLTDDISALSERYRDVSSSNASLSEQMAVIAAILDDAA